MSGVVFHHIAEGIMAQDLKQDIEDARDSTSILIPDVKNGNMLAADYVLSHLGINYSTEWRSASTTTSPVWGTAENRQNKKVTLIQQPQYSMKQIPDVTGMGARDAVYLIEKRGVRVKLIGRGKVVKQSLQPGQAIKRGESCILTLSI